MLKLRVAGVSAFVEPSAAAKTATTFAGGLVDAAFGACVWNRRGGAYNIYIMYYLVGLWTHAYS